MATNRKKEAIAYHEAGHAYAHIITGTPFEYVSIKGEEETEGRTSGGIKSGFGGALILISGYVSERIYSGSYNLFTAGSDFKDLDYIWLSDFQGPEKAKQEKNLIKYARRVLTKDWVHVTAIAEALLEEGTLSYEKVYFIARGVTIDETNSKKF